METTQTLTSPPAPSTFAGATAAKNLDGSRIQINWSAVPSGSTGYSTIKILKLQPDGSLSSVSVLPAGQPSYIDTGLSVGTLYSYVVQACDLNGNNCDGNHVIVSALTYPGINQAAANGNLPGATSISTTGAQINFYPPGGQSSGVNIYCHIRASADVLMAYVAASAGSYILSTLKSGSTYTCRVQAIITATGKEDGNGQTWVFQTIPKALTSYKGVALVQAYGDVQSTTSTVPWAPSGPTAKQVTITWNNFTVINPFAASYALVRVSHNSAVDTNTQTLCTPTTTSSCLVCISGPSASQYSRSCTDSLVGSAPSQYDYMVALVVDNTITPPAVEEAPSATYGGDLGYRIFVPIPPTNMVLVNRDSVNYEMCTLYLGQTPNPTAHQSCAYYGGIGATPASAVASGNALPYTISSNTYDMGYDFFIDRWQEGCNWSSASSPATANLAKCGNASVLAPGGAANGGTGDCYGQLTDFANGYFTVPQTPSASWGVQGSVFYDSGAAVCWYKNSNGTWISPVTTNNGGSTYYSSIATNAPDPLNKKPPLLGSPAYANNICTSNIDSYYGPKRMIRRREYVASAGFQSLNSDPNRILPGTLDKMYTQILKTSGAACNTVPYLGLGGGGFILGYSSGWGIPAPINATLNDTAFNANLSPNDWATFYHNNITPMQGYFVIGSLATSSCVSRYGAQDMLGNGAEWFSDQFYCSTATNRCAGQASTFDAGNTDMSTYSFDGSTGPGGTPLYMLPFFPTAANYTQYGFDSMLNDGGFYSFNQTNWNNTLAPYLNPILGLPMTSGQSTAGAMTGSAIQSNLLPSNAQLTGAFYSLMTQDNTGLREMSSTYLENSNAFGGTYEWGVSRVSFSIGNQLVKDSTGAWYDAATQPYDSNFWGVGTTRCVLPALPF